MEISEVFYPSGYSAKPGKSDINFIYNLRLPFRIRTSGFYRLKLSSSSEIVVRNTILVKANVPQDIEYAKTIYSPDIFSDVLIAINPSAFKLACSHRFPTPDTDMAVEIYSGMPLAVKQFNDFIVAYEIAARDTPNACSFGSVRPYRFLNLNDFYFRHERVMFKCVTPDGYTISDVEMLSMMDARPPQVGFREGRQAPFHDLSENDRNNISGAFHLTQDEIFYHFEFEANAAFREADPMHGLLMACVSLEAAHASLLRRRVGKLDPEFNSERAISDFLAKAGTSKTIELTPLFVMKKPERPPRDVMRKAIVAMGARNKIMHALRNSGSYTVRRFTVNELHAWSQSVLDLLQYFKRAIESDRANEEE